MNIFCWIFGHSPPVYRKKGWWSPGEEYGRVQREGTDGIGREHASVFGKCARCEQEVRIVRIHLPQREPHS